MVRFYESENPLIKKDGKKNLPLYYWNISAKHSSCIRQSKSPKAKEKPSAAINWISRLINASVALLKIHLLILLHPLSLLWKLFLSPIDGARRSHRESRGQLNWSDEPEEAVSIGLLVATGFGRQFFGRPAKYFLILLDSSEYFEFWSVSFLREFWSLTKRKQKIFIVLRW